MGSIEAKLVLENGEEFQGFMPSWQSGPYYGEVVFTTGMTGYVETLTDPSFAGQLIVFTYPLIGNYGALDVQAWESEKIWAAGAVFSEASLHFSHWEAKSSLLDWLEREKIPSIFGVDTRHLTKSIRKKGVVPGAIATDKALSFQDPHLHHLVERVSINAPVEEKNGERKKIILVDCGMKRNILRSFLKYDLTVKRVPFDYDYTEEEYDGVFISNGPGDPKRCSKTIEILKKSMGKEKPTFGICLGTQLMALAVGGDTYKMPFGHRGQNQPCLSLKDNRCYLTSQNHGYAIDGASLPKDWKESFRNLNDGTVEGIEHKELPFFAVQFHPEAAPGPFDTEWLFEKFYALL